jgi:hypothetical protein
MEALVLQPRTRRQANLLRQLAEAMSIPFSLLPASKIEGNPAFLSEIQTAGREARDIAAGKVKGQTLEDLLNELD